MSRYAFRKPTIGQQIDMTTAAATGDMAVVVRLLDELAVGGILDLPFSELGTIARDYARAIQAWQQEKNRLPDGVVDFLANLI